MDSEFISDWQFVFNGINCYRIYLKSELNYSNLISTGIQGLFIFTISIGPVISNLQKLIISLFPDKLSCLSIFSIFIPVFSIELTKYRTVFNFRTIGTAIITLLDAADFYFTSGLAEFSFTGVIARFASFAVSGAKWFAGFAVCTATADFFD